MYRFGSVWRRLIHFLSYLVLLYSLPVLGIVHAIDDVDSMLEMEFQELVQVKITSVSKYEENLYDAAAAVFVLTAEDIRRSSANTIPDLLRLVPGLHVAKSGSNNWAISARGFQNRFANKMLVMVDGRSIYTIGFGGVYWEHIDVPLGEIERIEVIRGPGGSVWGANAVNGVISIITKSAYASQGWNIQAGAGNEEKGFGSVRFGGTLGPETMYKLYAKSARFDETAETEGSVEQDDWSRNSAGFRLDSGVGHSDRFTLQGDVFHFDGDTAVLVPDFSLVGQNTADGANPTLTERETNSANILSRYEMNVSTTSQWVFQGYIDYFESNFGLADEESIQYDLDIQHNVTWAESIRTSYGINSRIYDHSISPKLVKIAPAEDNFLVVDAFVNNEIPLHDDVNFILGTKVGYNDYTDVEVQPSARALWKLTERQRVWAAVSRAVRVPDRQNNGVEYLNNFSPVQPELGVPTVFTLYGNENLDAEVLWAYEAGYRVQATSSIYVDLALFYNVYDDVITIDQGAPEPIMKPVSGVNIPFDQENNGALELYGSEISVTAELNDRWKLVGSYSHLESNIDYPDNTFVVLGGTDDGSFVNNIASLRSLLDLSNKLELDTTVRYMDSLPSIEVESYVAVDFRIGWHLSDTVELSFIGQNIFDSEHREHVTSAVNPHVGIERSFFWRLDIEI